MFGVDDVSAEEYEESAGRFRVDGRVDVAATVVSASVSAMALSVRAIISFSSLARLRRSVFSGEPLRDTSTASS